MVAAAEAETRAPVASMNNDDNYSASMMVESHPRRRNFCSCFLAINRFWRRITGVIHGGINMFVLTLSLTAARNPRTCIAFTTILSFSLLAAGFFTNFELSLNDEQVFAPSGTPSVAHIDWILNSPDTEGFSTPKRPIILLVHANGANVMDHAYEGMKTVFEVLDIVTTSPGYRDICPDEGLLGAECRITGPTRYWEHNQTRFEVENVEQSDANVVETVSRVEFWVAPRFMMGKYRYDNDGTIEYAESFITVIEIPDLEDGQSEAFEAVIIERLLPYRDQLQGTFSLDFYTLRTIPDEMTRAITADIPLIPIGFLIMATFTCLVFGRRDDKVQSRALLGVGSVVTILFSIMSGFGIAFICGIPFTSMTQILPFVIVGVGLDDTFVTTGAYFRTNPSQDTITRIRDTMREVGASISLTTTTTVLAFTLGCFTSDIPAIQWMCWYAAPTIFVVFVYQITFFVAILVLDQERINDNRRDCCICIKVATDDDDELGNDHQDADEQVAKQMESQAVVESPTSPEEPYKPERSNGCMIWYGNQLLRPRVKVVVMIVFAAFFACSIYSASLLEQDFNPIAFLPEESYAADVLESTDLYTTQKMQITAYFRGVNQSDEQVQKEMIRYIDDLAAMPQIQSQPDFCWVRDFHRMRDGSSSFDGAFGAKHSANMKMLFESNLTMSQQLNLVLSVPEVRDLYGKDISRNAETGEITASRCIFAVNYLDLSDVQDQVDMLADQRRVTAEQPINQGRDEFAFFNIDVIYFLWEFYTAAIGELIFTTVSGVVAVSFFAFVLIPHWSAVCFVLPFIMMLYVELLGAIQFAGLSINPLTYIVCVMAIGLLVDFLLHLILRYYESAQPTRQGKVKETLTTMGSSIFQGGFSTLLGVLPLAFSTSGIIKTVFIMFSAMVSLGLANGLILLPVVLSYVGPTARVHMGHQKPQDEDTASLSEKKTFQDEIDDYPDGSATDSPSMKKKHAAYTGSCTGSASSSLEDESASEDVSDTLLGGEDSSLGDIDVPLELESLVNIVKESTKAKVKAAENMMCATQANVVAAESMKMSYHSMTENHDYTSDNDESETGFPEETKQSMQSPDVAPEQSMQSPDVDPETNDGEASVASLPSSPTKEAEAKLASACFANEENGNSVASSIAEELANSFNQYLSQFSTVTFGWQPEPASPPQNESMNGVTK